MTDQQDEPPPPKPARLKARYEIEGGRMRIEFRRVQWGGGLFLALWLTVWTVGCVVLALAVITQRQIGMLLFALPFWASWVFVAVILIWMLFGRETLEVDSRTVKIWRQAWIKYGKREIPLDEITGFVAGERVTSSEDGRTEPCLTIQSIGKPVDLLAGLPETELLWLVAQLQQLLPEPTAQQPDSIGPAAGANEDGPTEDTLIYEKAAFPTRQSAGPPSDTRWRLSEEFDFLSFLQRGSWSWSGVFGLLFINCFWNGIVGVFVLVLFGIMPGQAPQGWERVGLAVFLIPFEVNGLFMFAGLVLALLEPFRQLAWRFESHEIICRLTWFGIGKTWRYPVERVDRLEIQPHVKPSKLKFARTKNNISENGDGAAWQHAMRIIDSDNRVICQVDELTQGEARWIAEQVKRTFATKWFR
ncbi:MAG: hypothetical protein K8T91_26920 [Planctomycetes bacterium]|nr:hypothetical protein [Planctomycetota bacterium]